MSKITLKIDTSLSYEKALQEFEKIYNEELQKNEKKEKLDSFLGNLYKLANSQLNTNFSNTNALIQALIPYTTSTFKEKLNASSATRRKTISMSKEIYQKIKTLLSEPNPNKAAIAREVGVSVVQVRKVAVGGYEKKFGTSNSSVSKVEKNNKDKKPLLSTESQSTLPLQNAKESISKTSNSVSRPPMKTAIKSPLDL